VTPSLAARVGSLSVEAAGAGEVADPSEVGFASQPDIKIATAMARPLTAIRVRRIDVSPMILFTGRHATSAGQPGSVD
jgi:hypothetical protein